VPIVYWVAVVLISIVGTLITDKPRETMGQPADEHDDLCARPAATFRRVVRERADPSIHTIVTSKREGFYWVDGLFTFALGTAQATWSPRSSSVGYWNSAVLFGGCDRARLPRAPVFNLNAILSFWIA